ncbi:ABC transporter substrate-binding protein [Pseudonocardia sp. GCM10023141]|uniref:ABC transporter substrate-binding protein n=1 Tax=Pseudonocardia sp. GCM10023141 TaxID=3252653 RepID=UPI00360F8B0A
MDDPAGHAPDGGLHGLSRRDHGLGGYVPLAGTTTEMRPIRAGYGPAPHDPGIRADVRIGRVKSRSRGCARHKETDDDDKKPTRRRRGSSGAGVGGCSSSAPGASGEIVIGAIGSYTGRTAATIGPAPDGIQAWAQAVNDAGGINGKKVKLLVEDDAGNATSALAKVKQLVERDHVIAIVSDNSVSTPAWAQYVEQKQIPVLGGFALTPPFSESAMFFPTGASYITQTYAEIEVAKSFGPKVASYVCAESPNCAALSALQNKVVTDAGVDLVINQTASSTAPSYVPQCQAAKDAGANAMIIKVPVRAVAEQCRKLGMQLGFVSGGGNVTADVLTSDAAQGLKNVDDSYPLFIDAIAEKTDSGRAFQAFVAKYAPTVRGKVSPFFSAAYIHGKLFEAAVEASHSDEVTSASILEGRYALPPDFTLDGLTAPLNYQTGQPTVVNCAYVDEIKNGAWAPGDQLQVCAPQALVNRLAQQK